MDVSSLVSLPFIGFKSCHLSVLIVSFIFWQPDAIAPSATLTRPACYHTFSVWWNFQTKMPSFFFAWSWSLWGHPIDTVCGNADSWSTRMMWFATSSLGSVIAMHVVCSVGFPFWFWTRSKSSQPFIKHKKCTRSREERGRRNSALLEADSTVWSSSSRETSIARKLKPDDHENLHNAALKQTRNVARKCFQCLERRSLFLIV